MVAAWRSPSRLCLQTILSVFHMHRLRVSTGKKVFFLILAALAGCPPWPSPDQADSLSWTGLQWRNDMVMKGQWAASHERAMDLLLDLGVDGFESLAGSSTISLDLSVLDPDAALFQVHDVPLNATVESMQTYAAMILRVSPDQISFQNANQTYINPLMPLSFLRINGEIELHVIPRDRVGGDRGESSAVPIEMMDFIMNAPVYPRDPSRRRVEEQPAPRDRPSRRANERWCCKALVEHLGTGKAVTGTWHPKFQEFTGPTSDDVVRQREAWIGDYLHPKPRGAKTGAKFAPTVESEGRTKRLATPNSMEEVRRAGPTSEQARPGSGRGHVFEPSAPSRLEEPVLIERMKADANWFEQAAARQVARATHLIGRCTLLCFHSMLYAPLSLLFPPLCCGRVGKPNASASSRASFCAHSVPSNNRSVPSSRSVQRLPSLRTRCKWQAKISCQISSQEIS